MANKHQLLQIHCIVAQIVSNDGTIDESGGVFKSRKYSKDGYGRV